MAAASRLPRAVVVLGLVSFCNNLASEYNLGGKDHELE